MGSSFQSVEKSTLLKYCRVGGYVPTYKQEKRSKKQDIKLRYFHLYKLSVLPLASNVLASVNIVFVP